MHAWVWALLAWLALVALVDFVDWGRLFWRLMDRAFPGAFEDEDEDEYEEAA